VQPRRRAWRAGAVGPRHRLVEANVLREDLVTEVLQEVRRRLAKRAKEPNTEGRRDLEAEWRRLRAEVDRLVSAMAR
jgi:hypothetical protein